MNMYTYLRSTFTKIHFSKLALLYQCALADLNLGKFPVNLKFKNPPLIQACSVSADCTMGALLHYVPEV